MLFNLMIRVGVHAKVASTFTKCFFPLSNRGYKELMHTVNDNLFEMDLAFHYNMEGVQPIEPSTVYS